MSIGSKCNSIKILDFGQVKMDLLGDPMFGKISLHSVPDQVFANSIVVQNCLSTQETSHQTISLSVAKTDSSTITKTVSNTSGGSISLKASFFGLIDGTGTVNYSETMSAADARSHGVTETSVQTSQVDVTVPANTAVVAQLQVVKQHASVPFTVQVALDAPLSANDRGLISLSSIFPIEKRTLIISGETNIEALSTSHVLYLTAPYDKDKCVSGQPTVTYSGASPEILGFKDRRVLHLDQ